MQYLSRQLLSLRRLAGIVVNIDRGLILALFLAAAFSMQGINWGRVECWNPDEMALRSIFVRHQSPFEPGTFTKPPFHTYLAYFTVVLPVRIVEGIAKAGHKLFGPKGQIFPGNLFGGTILLGARFLTLSLFLGSVSLIFEIIRRSCGLFAGRVSALLMATSAGFIVYNHFLTADSPMLFWMLLGFFFCQQIFMTGKMADYILAGFFVGIGTATKYNALAVGLAIPVAHLLRSSSIKEALFDRRVIYGVLMVPAGFLFGCPYALLDYRKFVKDFMYNYTVTPNYDGRVTGHSYIDFLFQIPEILGWPGTAFVVLAALASLCLSLARKPSAPALRGFILAVAVAALYYIKIGSFPRIADRFVLPVVPLLFLLMGPFLAVSARRPLTVCIPLIPILAYNCVSSFYVGIRFSDDPRMAAQTWVRSHLAANTSIESSPDCPHWEKLPSVTLDVRTSPDYNERGAIFSKLFANNQWVMDSLEKREGHVNPADFTAVALKARNPQFLAMDSNAYHGLKPGPIKSYFTDIVAGRYPYQIVFDLANPPLPAWIYPHRVDCIENRITILEKISDPQLPVPPARL